MPALLFDSKLQAEHVKLAFVLPATIFTPLSESANVDRNA